MGQDIVCVSGIYAITNTVNGKRYVGSSVNVRARWVAHIRLLEKGTHHSAKLQNSWAKNGKNLFQFSVIEIISSQEKLIPAEQKWIDKFEAFTVGYNMNPTAGTCKGLKRSAKARENMSLARKLLCQDQAYVDKLLQFLHSPASEEKKLLAIANTVITQERRDKCSKAKLGFKFSAESIQKMKLAHLGVKLKPESIAKREATKRALGSHRISDEQKDKLRVARTGKRHTPESLEKCRLAKLGKKLTPESIAKRTATQKANRLAKTLLAT